METTSKQKVGLPYRDSKMELIPDTDCEIVHEEGKWYVVRKEEKYPKTYVGCCSIMGIEYPFIKKHEDTITASCYKNNLIVDFVQLLICRDAYWKIAGDWKYDVNKTEDYFYIVNKCGRVTKEHYMNFNHILVFPSEEMRDAFYENFKDAIGQCKELL